MLHCMYLKLVIQVEVMYLYSGTVTFEQFVEKSAHCRDVVKIRRWKFLAKILDVLQDFSNVFRGLRKSVFGTNGLL